MVLGLIAKWGTIAAGITIFILFVVRSSQVGIGNATNEIGSGIGNIGTGIGATGSGIAKFGQGIGAGITGLFSPLQFFKDLIYGATPNPTAAAANQNTVTTSTQNTTTTTTPKYAWNLTSYLSTLQQNQKNLGGQSALNTQAQNRSISIARGTGAGVTNSHRVSVRGGYSAGSASTQARRSAGKARHKK
jgi:hypothetical protein